jgi:hypothetical protein
MRIAPIALALAIAATGLTLVTPEGSAFGWCSAYLHNDGGPYNCGGYVLCVGYSWGIGSGFHCQYGVPPPCDLFTCGPGPVLP